MPRAEATNYSNHAQLAPGEHVAAADALRQRVEGQAKNGFSFGLMVIDVDISKRG